VTVDAGGVPLPGTLQLPGGAAGIVVFAHGSGSSRLSPRNLAVAGRLNRSGLGTLLFDLLTPAEGADRARVFDIPLLAGRLVAATTWLQEAVPTAGALPIGYFGASTGAGAALWAASERRVAAVVSRGGRPDLAAERLPGVRAPTLLIVGENDLVVLGLNLEAQSMMQCETDVEIVPDAGHLFEEPGALEEVGDLAAGWFRRWMAG
jgi:putative phosphoribosyl transferase